MAERPSAVKPEISALYRVLSGNKNFTTDMERLLVRFETSLLRGLSPDKQAREDISQAIERCRVGKHETQPRTAVLVVFY